MEFVKGKYIENILAIDNDKINKAPFSNMDVSARDICDAPSKNTTKK